MAKRKDNLLRTLSAGQLEIMHLVWERGEVTVTEVWTELVRRRQVARNTVLTLMERLRKKGWLKRRVDGPAHSYSAAVARATALGEVVHRLVDAAFAGSAEALVLALVDGRGVSDEEAKRIRQLIDRARSRRPTP